MKLFLYLRIKFGTKLQDSESCPMDNLNLLMLLAQYERFRRDPKLEGAIDLLLLHWKNRLQPWRPYGFGIGDQFLKLKLPERPTKLNRGYKAVHRCVPDQNVPLL